VDILLQAEWNDLKR